MKKQTINCVRTSIPEEKVTDESVQSKLLSYFIQNDLFARKINLDVLLLKTSGKIWNSRDNKTKLLKLLYI